MDDLPMRGRPGLGFQGQGDPPRRRGTRADHGPRRLLRAVRSRASPVLDELGVTFRIMKGFGSFTSVKEAVEYASDCRGATPERVPILHP